MLPRRGIMHDIYPSQGPKDRAICHNSPYRRPVPFHPGEVDDRVEEGVEPDRHYQCQRPAVPVHEHCPVHLPVGVRLPPHNIEEDVVDDDGDITYPVEECH